MVHYLDLIFNKVLYISSSPDRPDIRSKTFVESINPFIHSVVQSNGMVMSDTIKEYWMMYPPNPIVTDSNRDEV